MNRWRARLIAAALIFTFAIVPVWTNLENHRLLQEQGRQTAELARQSAQQAEHRACNEFYHEFLAKLILAFAAANPAVYGQIQRDFQGLPTPRLIDPNKCAHVLDNPIVLPLPQPTVTVRQTTVRTSRVTPGPTRTVTPKPEPQPTATVTVCPVPVLCRQPRNRTHTPN